VRARPRELRRRGVCVWVSLAVAVADFVIAVAGGLLHGIGCLGDYHPENAFKRYCERNTRGETDLEDQLVLFGPTLLSVGAGALSVWRRQVLYVLVAAVLLIPLAFVLPFLVLS
jgi:hypothetical protein